MDQGVIRSLKAHYRLCAVQKMILAVEMNKQLPTSILDAMSLLEFAWDQVSESTIKATSGKQESLMRPKTTLSMTTTTRLLI